MIHEVFQALKDGLIEHIRLSSGASHTEPAQEPVVFLKSDKLESVEFPQGSVTMMLVNLEEDRKVLPADPYRRTLPDGTSLLVKPPVPLNLYVLFVARFPDYLDSLRNLSLVVQFFQRHRVIDQESLPALRGALQKLVCELVTIPINEHNQVWSLLQTAYQPSLLYKIKMVVFHDEDGFPAAAPGSPSMKVNS